MVAAPKRASPTRSSDSIFRLIFELFRWTVTQSRMQTASVVVVFDKTLDTLEQVFIGSRTNPPNTFANCRAYSLRKEDSEDSTPDDE